MRKSMRLVIEVVCLCAFAVGWSACPDDGKQPIGGSCDSDADCDSGLCVGQVCVDPNGDEDGDGVANFIEVQLGSDPLKADTDGDGRPDGTELAGLANVDTDGDGIPDILESALLDSDGDCITDQFDAHNAIASADPSPMRDVVCGSLGICAGQDRSLFGVLCTAPDHVAVCDYHLVPGFESPEVTCDGLDQNCDGDADDGLPDLDDDGLADCVDDDRDGDGVANAVDVCPTVADADQDDQQSDGIGDACAADYTLTFTLAPTTPLAAGAPFDAMVALRDADGATVTRFNGAVTLSLAGGAAANALTGTLTVTAIDGVASFSGLAITAPGEGATLAAQSGDLAAAASAPFAVIPGAFDQLLVSGAPATVIAGDATGFTLVALDAFANVLTTFDGTVAFSATDPQADLPLAMTFTPADAGELAVTGLILRTAGAQTVTVMDAATEAVLAAIQVSVTHAPATDFAISGLAPEIVAGTPAPLMVMALDPFGNLAADFAGTARFTADDAAATLPADHTFVAADGGMFNTQDLVLRTAGPHTLTVADGAIDGTAITAVTHAEAAGLVVTALTDPITAGAPFTVEVKVVDAFGNLVTDFTGAVALTSDDPLATLPPTYTFTAADQGVHIFEGVTLISSGDRSVSATVPGTAIAGGLGVPVTAASNIVFELGGVPSPTTAGVAFDLTLVVKDVFGNAVTDFTGTVALLSNDPLAVLPPARTLTLADAGSATIAGVTLKTAGARTLTAADTAHAIVRTVNVNVAPAAASTFDVGALAAQVTAGVAQTLTLTLRDPYGNLATDGHAGTFAITTTDAAAVISPATLTLGPADLGVKTFNVALRTAGAQTVTIAEPALGTVDRATTVRAAAPSAVAVSDLPPNVTAGVATAVVVRVTDAFNNTVSNYAGVVNVTASAAAVTFSPGASLSFPPNQPASATVTASFATAGAQHLDFVDAALGATGIDSTSTTVGPAAAHTVAMTPASGTTVAGTAFDFTVTAYDRFGNVATGYTGLVSFTSDDAQGSIPAATQYTATDAGMRGFSAMLATAGVRRITATGGGLTGPNSATLSRTVSASATLARLAIAPSATTVVAGATFSATVTPHDPYDNVMPTFAGSVAMAVSDPAGTTPSPVTMAGATAVSPIVMKTAGAATVTVTLGALSASTSVTVNPAAPDHLVWATPPSAGQVDLALAPMEVAAYDPYNNLATATAPLTITLLMGRNAGPGRLAGTTAATTSGGIARFTAARVDRPGLGYDLVAAGLGVTGARSSRFDIAWPAPAISQAPIVTGASGCRMLDYGVSQANSAPTDVLVEYRVGAGAWKIATQAPSGAGDTDGTTAIAASPDGVPHAFAWDAYADIGRTAATAVALRVTPRVGTSLGTPATTAPFDVDLGWSLDVTAHALTPEAVHGAIATGDFDQNGLPDIAVARRDESAIDILYQTQRNAFTLVPQLFDITGLDIIAMRPWRDGPFDRGLFALGTIESDLYAFQSGGISAAALVPGWAYSRVAACPDPIFNMPRALAVGHTSGSADQEVFVACAGSDIEPPSVSWTLYSNLVLGAQGGNLPLPTFPTALELGDLGHDGARDLIIGDLDGLRTAINEAGDGFCLTAGCGAQQIAMLPPTALVVADFDADGQLDVVAVHGAESASYVAGELALDGQGLPTRFLATGATALTLSLAASTVEVGDVDTDGDLDLIFGSSLSDAVEILRGNGDGTFSSAGVVSTGAGADAVSGLVVTDLDSDGQPDVLVGRLAPIDAAVTRIDGAAIPRCRASFATASGAGFAVKAAVTRVADLDGDGRPDSFWATGTGSATKGLMIGLGDGAGGYLRNFAAFATTNDPSDLAVGDLNGDGLLDAVLADGVTDNARIALQSPGQAGAFVAGNNPALFADVSVPSLNVVDLDADGRSDLIYLGEGAVRPYYQSAAGTLAAGAAVALAGTNLRGLATADITKDGYQDLAFFRDVAGAGAEVCVLRSQGARAWEAPSAMTCDAISSGVGRVMLTDLDRDGVEELLYVSGVSANQPAEVHVRRQVSADSGLFGVPEVIASCVGGQQLTVADANGDGRLDLAVACGTSTGTASRVVEVYLQGADGAFGAPAIGYGRPDGLPQGLALADVNGDQRADGIYGATVTRQASDGAATMVSPTRWAASPTPARLVAAADLDGDTLPDVVTASASAFSVIRQTAPGQFGAPVTYPLAGVNNVYDIVVTDVDNDGRNDVLVTVDATGGARQLRIFHQNQRAPGVFDTQGGVTTLAGATSGLPVALAADDILGGGVPAVLVSWASTSLIDDFTVYFPASGVGYLAVPSDPYTTAFPTAVTGASFGAFGGVYHDPIVAGYCGSRPCAVVGTLGACDVVGVLCYQAGAAVDLGDGAAAPLYVSLGGFAVADLDHDGLDDLVASLGRADGGHVYAVVRQDATQPGLFLPMQTFAAGTPGAKRLRLLDLDHDGLLDLVGQYDAGRNLAYEVLLGRGNGASFGGGFVVVTGLTSSDAGSAWSDIDRDGWLDLVTTGANPTSGEILVAPQR